MIRRAFTMVEMLTVIVVLATLAVIMAPNLASSVKANAVRTYFSSVDRLPAIARQRAMSTGTMVTLVADESGAVGLLESDGDQDAETERVTPPSEIAVDSFLTASGESSATEWQVRFFPDGTSDRGALEFNDNGSTWALVIDDQGRGRLQRGEAPDLATDRWEAGDRVQRS